MVELSLDSGEKRIMYPGDVSINRCGMHVWTNPSPSHPARVIYVLLDVKNATAAGQELKEEMGQLANEYV